MGLCKRRWAVVLALLVAGIWPGSASGTSAPHWHWLNPLPQGNNIQGVTCVPRGACYAVGDFGTVLTTDTSGAAWVPLRSGTQRALAAVACGSGRSCYAVGPYGTILVTHDAGRDWVLHRVARTYLLASISCPGKNVCFTLGSDLDHQCFVHSCKLKGQNVVLLRTRDGGATWRRLGADGVSDVFDLACPSTVRCVTIAYGGSILRTTNGGENWKHFSPSLPRLTDVSLQAIACPTASRCYVAGRARARSGNVGIWLTGEDGGAQWQKVNSLQGVSGVVAPGSISCSTGATCEVVGPQGDLAVTNDGGRHWRTQKIDGLENPGALACSSPQVCHVLGPYSSILTTSDGGQTWHNYATGPQVDLSRLTCLTSASCRTLASSGRLLTTDDRGKTWTDLSVPVTAGNGVPPALACTTLTTCLVVGDKGSIYRTSNEGQTWQKQSNPFSRTELPLAGISCPSASVCFVAGSGCLVSACTSAASRVVVLGSVDGGTTWRTLDSKLSSTLNNPFDVIVESMACPTVSACYVAGSPGFVMSTKDGGQSWDDKDSPALGSNLELTSIACPATSVCYAVGYGCRGESPRCTISDFAGTVLSTTDGGKSWKRYESSRTTLTAGKVCGSRPTISCPTSPARP